MFIRHIHQNPTKWKMVQNQQAYRVELREDLEGAVWTTADIQAEAYSSEWRVIDNVV